MQEIKYQVIKIPVSAAGESIKFSADMDKMYKRITGLYGLLPEDKAVIGTRLELKISDKEIFPEEYEIRMISTSQSVAPKERFYPISEQANGNRIEGRVTDSGKADAYPYIAKLILKLEEKI